MRPLISYEDLSGSQQAAPVNTTNHTSSSSNRPNKKRKRTNIPRRPSHSVQHWDDPGESAGQMNYNEGENLVVTSASVNEVGCVIEGGVELEAEGGEDSRELTHEEIWDDSALIDAWNAATEEYEAFHGDKDWKKQPVNKSPLWYNVPRSNPKKTSSKPRVTEEPSFQKKGGDSKPLNFDTFVPTHDPTLDNSEHNHLPLPSADISIGQAGSAQVVSQDEAFTRALGAMYWTGYWTAVYHCRRGTVNDGETLHDATISEQEECEDLPDEYHDNDMSFIPTQR